MGPEIYNVTPLAGFSPNIGRYLAMLDDVSARVRKYVDGLTASELDWIPNSRCESIATVMFHIAAVERSWIGEDIFKNPMSEKQWKEAFALRIGIPQISGKELGFYLDVLQTTRTETKESLKALTDDDLAREVTPLEVGEGNEGKRFTIEWILYHIVEHEAHHKGQIALMKRLLPAVPA